MRCARKRRPNPNQPILRPSPNASPIRMRSCRLPWCRLPQGTGPFLPHADLFDALDNDLDHIAFVLDRLHHGEVDTPLPWIAEEVATQSAEHAGVPMPPAPTPPPPTPAAHSVVIPLPVAAQPAAPEPAEHAQPSV